MTLAPAIALYDPRRLSEADFLAGFIARTDLAEHLVAQLRRTAADGDPRHRLILGARGMGKTSLLRRLAIGIAQEPALAEKLLPLTFREEQYNVRSLDQLWRNCGEALAEWLEASGDEAAATELDRAMLGPEWRDTEQAGMAFCARMSAIGRRPVLLIDNLDLILDALPSEQHWQWRRHLQAEGGPILIGAATQAPRQLGEREAAFYEFFRLDRLEPLTEEELLRCLQRLAEHRAEAGQPVLEVLRREPERLRVLHTLTGGNPRILALLYQVLERAESDTVFADLEALLDQVTPLYKARVEELRTDLQRAMLDAVALHWDPVTANILARITDTPVTTVSSQLSRLQEAGYVTEVPTSGARAGYQLAERFFNIWYLMRHGTRRTRQRMAWLTGFLAEFFSWSELQGMRARLTRGEGSKWYPLYAEALEAALEAPALRQGPGRVTATDVDFQDAMERAEAAAAADDFITAVSAYREATSHDPANTGPWERLGDLLVVRLGRPEEAEEAYREAIARDQKNAWLWLRLGNLLASYLGRPEEAEHAYREAIVCNPQEVRPWIGLGNLLADHLGRPNEAEDAYREAIKLDPKNAWSWNGLGNLLADYLGRSQEAEHVYVQAIACDPSNPSIHANVMWFRLAGGTVPTGSERSALENSLPPVGLYLLDAGIALACDNLGAAMEQLAAALALPLYAAGMGFLDDLLRVLRLAHRRGQGERLISWFESSGQAERQAPLFAAFVALERGPATLRDINPETRAVAERLYKQLRPSGVAPPAPPRRRGRPRRRG
jgi:Flp pilus assembly protein TadD/DNA-binding transcriptional ArsR family regulator